MTAKNQQVQNSIIYMFPMISGSLLPFITLPIFTRILTKEDYGALALANIYAILATGIANFGMSVGFERNYFQFRDDKKKMAQLLYSTLSFVLTIFLLLAGITYVLRAKISTLFIGSPSSGNLVFWAFCGHFFFTIAIQFYLIFYKNAERATDFSLYTIASGVMNFLISLFLVAGLRTGIIGIVYSQLISGALIFVILSYKFLKIFPLSLNKAIFMESFRISYPLTPRVFLGVIGTQFDTFMINLLATLGGAGLYHIGRKISEVIFAFMNSLENVFQPQVYKRMFDLKEKGGESIGTYLTPFIYISISLALAVSLFAEELIFVLTPKSYHEAANIVVILSMYYGFLFFGKIVGPQLIFKKKTHITSLLTFVIIGINVALNIPLIMKFGAIGAAWGTFLSGMISGFICIIISQRYYRINWETAKIGAIFFIFFGSAILLTVFNYFAVDYLIKLLFKALALIGYGCLGIKLKIISKENIVLVKNIIIFKRAATA